MKSRKRSSRRRGRGGEVAEVKSRKRSARRRGRGSEVAEAEFPKGGGAEIRRRAAWAARERARRGEEKDPARKKPFR